MKKLIYTLLLGSFILPALILMNLGCKSTKPATVKEQGETLIETYCSGPDYQTDKEHLRATGIGQSMDQTVSRKMAMSNAYADLAASMSTLVKGVTDNYVKSASPNNKEELMTRFESLNRTVVNEKLSGTKVICEKQTITKDKNYKTYIAIELTGDELFKSISNKVSNDDLLKIDYNYEKFKKVFDEEMSNQAAGQNK
jgi:hypothetical protein